MNIRTFAQRLRNSIPAPTNIMDMSIWKITLPVGPVGNPIEILYPTLQSGVTYAPWYRVSSSKDSLVFRANVEGVPTSGSNKPRSELREMLPNQNVGASWSTSSGIHTMTGRTKITHLPTLRPHVIVAQLYNSSTPLVMRLEGARLKINDTDTEVGVLDAAYVLGTAFDWKIVSSGAHNLFYYNGVLKLDYVSDMAVCYFKAGCYTQSNLTSDAAGEYAEVVHYPIKVEHS